MQDCMGKLARADAGSSGKLRLCAVDGNRCAPQVVDVDLPVMIHHKLPKWATDWAGESPFAGAIKKEEYPFTGPVTLAGVPQAGPLTDGENLPSANASNGLVHTKADLRESNRVFTRGRSLNLQDCSGEDVSGAASELIKGIDLSTRPRCATAKIAGKSKKLVTAIFRRRSRIAFLCELKSIPAGSRTMLVKTGVAGCAECHKRM